LVAEAVKALVGELVGDSDRSMAVEDFRGEEVDLAAVADACQTPPFLADRRVVIARDVGRWSTEEIRPLLAYLEDPIPTTALVLAGGGGQTAPKLVATVKEKGHVVATSINSRDTKGWVRDRLRNAPVRLDAAAEALVVSHLGEDVTRLRSLIDVLVAAFGEGCRLGAADVEPHLGAAGSVTPWELTDAIDEGRTEVALALLHRMLGAGERHPLVVLTTLHRHAQSMLRVSSPHIATEAQAAAALGIGSGRSTYPAKKALASARRLGPPAVAESVSLVADAELYLKGTQEWPGELVLEVLVARLCRLSRGAGRRMAPPAGARRGSVSTPGRR